VRAVAFLIAVLAAVPCPAWAGAPTEAVRPFYTTPGLEFQPAARDRFIDPARKVLDADEAIRKSGETDGCLDPALAFDDTDYDYADVMASLKFVEAVKGDQAVVSALFRAEGEPARVEWKLRKVGEEWKIADIFSLTKDWALSQFNCE
jgi:hypothetical protein